MSRVTSAITTIAISVAVAALVIGCERATALEKIPIGSRVTIGTNDGRVVEGTLAKITVDRVVVESEDSGEPRELSRDLVATVRQDGWGIRNLRPVKSEAREVTIPMGTTISIQLETAMSSDGNRPEDPIRAHTREPIRVGRTIVVPAGSEVSGIVTAAKASGKVKGRAGLSFRFTRVRAYGETYGIATRSLVYQAEGTKAADAKKIGIGAAAGAVIGGITGGKKGAAIGSAVGTGAGTAVVLTTPGKEVRLRSGSILQLQLRESVTIRVPREDL